MTLYSSRKNIFEKRKIKIFCHYYKIYSHTACNRCSLRHDSFTLVIHRNWIRAILSKLKHVPLYRTNTKMDSPQKNPENKQKSYAIMVSALCTRNHEVKVRHGRTHGMQG